jgi:hypothetical protein
MYIIIIIMKNDYIKTCEGVEVYLLHSYPVHQMGVNGQVRAPAALLPVPVA